MINPSQAIDYNYEQQISKIIKFVETYYCGCEVLKYQYQNSFPQDSANYWQFQVPTEACGINKNSGAECSNSTASTSPSVLNTISDFDSRKNISGMRTGQNNLNLSNPHSITYKTENDSSSAGSSTLRKRDMINYEALKGHKYEIIPNPNKTKEKNTRVFVCKYDN